MNRMLVGVGHLIPPWLVALSAVLFFGTAAILGLSCPSAEELEDWSIHYHRDRHGDQGPRT
jgi:hypothetical protein